MRPLCKACGRNSAAINCYHKDKIYYRSMCNACVRRNKSLPRQTPRWQSAGYRKKSVCDRCGFRARHGSQLTVWHVDGNQNNCELRNLKTICLNCIQEITRLDLPWRQGDIEPDY
jgi:hypothetical protein